MSNPFAVLLVLVGQTSAQEPSRRITLEAAVGRAAVHNADLRVARARHVEAAAQARQSRGFPNPVAQLTRESLSDAGLDAGETYLTLGQQLEWPWVRAARSRAADFGTAAAEARLTADSARVVFAVRRTYVEVWAAERRLSTAERVAGIFRRTASQAEARFAEGDVSGYEMRRLRLELAGYERAAGIGRLTVNGLARALGTLIDPEDVAAAFLAEGLPSFTPLDIPLDRLEPTAWRRRPALAAAERGVGAARARLTHARRARLPAPSLVGGYKTQDDGLSGLFVGVSLPVPVFDRRSGEVAAAEARLEAEEAALVLARRTLSGELRGALERLRFLAEQYWTFQEAGAEAHALADIAIASYAEGELDLSGLLEAAKTLAKLDGVAVEAAADYWISYFELDRAAGGLAAEGGIVP